MSAGTYRTPVDLEQPVQTVATSGETVLVYTAAGSGFAAIKAVRQADEIRGGRLDGIVTHSIRMRYRADLAGGWRVMTGSQVFRVLSVTDPDQRERDILCLAEEEGT